MSKRVENTVGQRRKAILRILWAMMAVGLTALLALTRSHGWVSAQATGAWSTPVNLSQSDTASVFPDIAVDSAGHVYVVWGEHSSDDVLRPDLLLFRMWDGQTWSPPNDIAVAGHLPQIAVDSQGRLHVIRIANGLEYKRAWAQGDPSDAQAWTPGQDLSIGNPYWPDMVVDSQDRIHVVFTDEGGIHYRRSMDGGDSWSVPIQLDTPRVEGAETPRLAVDGLDNLYAVWQVLGPSFAGQDPWSIAVGFSTSTDGGETWALPREVIMGDEGYEWPQIAVDSVGTIHVVWRYRDAAIGTVGYVRSSDGGRSWSPVEILRLGSTGQYALGLGVDSADHLHLVIPLAWGDLPMGVSHLVRPPGGGWSPLTRISENPCNAGSADAELVISQGNRLHVVWYDRLECKLGFAPPAGRGEIFYSTLTTDAPATPPKPLPPMPTAAAIATVVPTSQGPSPTPTATAAPRRPERGGDDAATQPAGSPMAVGIGMSVGLITVIVFLWSIARHSHRYR